MSINDINHAVKQFSTNVELLLQIKGGKFYDAVTHGSYVGEAASPVDQYGSIEMQPVTGRFGPMGRVDAATDRRWVFPTDWDLPQLIDTADKLRLIIDPQSKWVLNAVNAARRRQDKLILGAFYATAKTGTSGGTTTSYTSGNTTTVSVGGTNSKINLAKIRAVRKAMEAGGVDFDDEEVYIGIPSADSDALLGEVQLISADFNGGAPVLKNGKVDEFMGFKFIRSELVETECAGTNKVTLPVWTKSGMHFGMWNDIKHTIDVRPDLQNRPMQLYTVMTAGATRIEETKVFGIESYRA